MKLHIHGVHVPNRKNTAELAALRLPIPETVEIPATYQSHPKNRRHLHY